MREARLLAAAVVVLICCQRNPWEYDSEYYASTLSGMYRANPAAVLRDHRGSRIRINGTVRAIRMVLGTPLIDVDGCDLATGTTTSWTAADLSAGDRVTAICDLVYSSSAPRLDSCNITARSRP